jgi:hypothetical protein
VKQKRGFGGAIYCLRHDIVASQEKLNQKNQLT